ncbi:hypothetical protein INT43_003691 [Umbelopsis isabellina]|uniref:Uncharacterized protein n=1 Tax=Mortierella isabellina TaxID=91625 RepID=A0A8H7PU27_MORIS|nr:hypothetical protein INT43_003691 [Umbelopsis isabellina]
MQFGEVDPAALILATVAVIIALETILRPLCKHVRKPRKAYTQFYRRAMIMADTMAAEELESDWVLSLAISKTAFMGLWSWNNTFAETLLDTPIGLGQWMLYPASLSGSGIFTAWALLLICPIWLLKAIYIKFICVSLKGIVERTQKFSIAAWLGVTVDVPVGFHIQVLENLIQTLSQYDDSLYGQRAQSVLSSLARSVSSPLGAEVSDLPGVLGCSKTDRPRNIAKMVRILLSHDVVQPIDLIISTWGLTQEQLYQIQFSCMILQQDPIERRIVECKHWAKRNVRLNRKMKQLATTSPWCDCSNFCFCSLRGIMFAPPSKSYNNMTGVIISNNVARVAKNLSLRKAGAIALAGRPIFEVLKENPLVIVGEGSVDKRRAVVLQMHDIRDN